MPWGRADPGVARPWTARERHTGPGHRGGREKDTSSGQYSGTTYSPVVRFTTVEGRTVEFTSAVGYSRSPDIGGAVPVRYRPNDPEQAEIDRATTGWCQRRLGW
jgi:hypothetical protein